MFTDIEGSTRLWEQEPERMQPALACHDALARKVVEGHGGVVVRTMGDGLYAAFDQPLDAIGATLQLQQALADPRATHGVALRARCGLHLGAVEERDNDYFGTAVNRTARIMGVAHGGQVIVSQAVIDQVADRLPAPLELRDLGTVRLKDLARPERVYQVLHPQLRQDFPALRSLEATPNNLPQQLTLLVGREGALSEVRRLLGDTRLLTVVGVGGLGKTRLTLQVGADVLDDFPDGVWFVELAPLSDAGLVPQAVASVLGVKEEPGRTVQEALLKFIEDRKLLLILDNCEHLGQACAELSKRLLQAGAQLKVLASSREHLHVAGETTYSLAPLSIPSPHDPLTVEALTQCEAVRLFVERAVAARQVFRVTDRNAGAVADICRQLDGIPLALELAAARVRGLSVEAIAARLSYRFRLLTGGDKTELPRQQTMRACIDWSYELLTEPERALLRRLAVFGGWTLEAAEAVCAGGEIELSGVLDLLTQLVEKSLVALEAEGKRYHLLETVRQYARDRLQESGEEAEWLGRHLLYFVQLAEEAEPQLKGAEQQAWLDRLETEHDNLRSALGWSTADDAERGLRLAGALWRFWYVRGYFGEGRGWLSGLFASATHVQNAPARAKALSGAGALAIRQSDLAVARVLFEESLAIQRGVGDRLGIAASLHSMGIVASHSGDYANGRALLEQALAIRRELGDRSGIAATLMNLGAIAADLGDYMIARALTEESLAIARELGDRFYIAGGLAELGDIAFRQGDYATSRALTRESLTIRRDLGDREGIVNALRVLSSVANEEHDYESARALIDESLAISIELGHRGDLALGLDELAHALALVAPGRAARIWGGAERLREEIGRSLPPSDRARFDHHVAGARAALGDDAAFDQAWREGREMSLDEVVKYALSSVDTPHRH